MIIRQPSSSRRLLSSRETTIPKSGFHRKYFIVALVLAIIGVSWLFLGTSHASSVGAPVKSGWSSYCLDDYRDKTGTGNQVDIWPCNNSEAQDWSLSLTEIKHGSSDDCLTAASDSKIVVDDCRQAANQVWLEDNGGYINPNSGLCLTAPNKGQGQLLDLDSCDNLSSSTQSWTASFDYSDYKCEGDQASQVACHTVKEWIAWQANPSGHEALLNNYTGEAAYEEWCADFVSYVYKEAGHPFTSGNYGGWDENDANQIQAQGFTFHPADGYIPKAGDVAYFSYSGGHVEIVVSGGKTPTFIYGNSDTIDPTTGNGNMATNTILNEGNSGKIQYYLSPNSST